MNQAKIKSAYIEDIKFMFCIKKKKKNYQCSNKKLLNYSCQYATIYFSSFFLVNTLDICIGEQ